MEPEKNNPAPQASILIAEDDEFLVKVLSDRLSKEGFSVVTAHDGEQALQMIQQGNVALAILDIIMPKKTGFDVVEALKQDPVHAQIPILILSNLGQEGDIARGRELGIQDYFVKANISLSSVVDRIRQLVPQH